MDIVTIHQKDVSDELLYNIANLLNEGFHDSIDVWMKRFALWWSSNPYVSENTEIGWVIVNSNGGIDGFYGIIPILFQYNDITFLVGSGTSYYVRPEARGTFSTALAIQLPRQKQFESIILTTVNSKTEKMYPRMGYKIVSEKQISNFMVIISLHSFVSMMGFLLAHFSDAETGAKKRIFAILARCSHITSEVIPKTRQDAHHPHLFTEDYELRICTDASTFLQYLPHHKKGDSIEFSKDKTTLDWILFSPEVQALLHRKAEQIFTKDGTYCGYIIYDIQHVGAETTLRIRELQLLKPENAIVKLILKHLKIEARNAGCAAIYSGLLAPDPELNRLLHKNIRLSLKTKNRYFVKFRKNVITDVDPYAIYVPSDLDPDAGFI